MANEKRPCDQFCSWNDPSGGCIIPAYATCPMSNTEPDCTGWGNVRANEKRLIDANDLEVSIKSVKEKLSDGSDWIVGYACGLGGALDAIKEMPTIEAEPVVRGEWEKYTDDKFMGYGADGRIRYRKVYSYKCSKCWNYTAVKHNYCPNCGAKMDGDGNG